MTHIIERTLDNFPEFNEVREKALHDNMPSNHNLLKESMMVRLKPNVSREDRLMI